MRIHRALLAAAGESAGLCEPRGELGPPTLNRAWEGRLGGVHHNRDQKKRLIASIRSSRSGILRVDNPLCFLGAIALQQSRGIHGP